MPRLLMLQHEDNCGPARLGAWLAAAGVDVVVRHTAREAVPPSLEGYDGLVVLGGSMSATSDGEHAWLPAVKARVREAVAADLPYLGVCLGMQVAADALGGTVARHARLVLGPEVQLRTPEGRADVLLGLPADPLVATHYNSDAVVALPEGAVALAHAADGLLTAVRFAPRAWGVQFHLEVDGAGFADWTIDKPEEKRPAAAHLADLAAAVAGCDDAVAAAWRPVAEAFARELGRSTGARPDRQ